MRTPLRSYALMFAGFLAILTSCKHEIPELPEDTGGTVTPPPPPPVDDCDPDTIYFEQDILPLIVSSCAVPGCHSATPGPADFSLNNYNAILTAEGGDVVVPGNPGASEMMEVITLPPSDPDFMPQDGTPLSAEQIQMISTWIAQGAQNNSCESSCDTLNVTWSGTINSIIAYKCQGCHSGASPQGQISLTSYAQVAAIALDGSLEAVINAEPGYTAMPYQSAALPQCEIDQIRIWVEAGAPNN